MLTNRLTELDVDSMNQNINCRINCFIKCTSVSWRVKPFCDALSHNFTIPVRIKPLRYSSQPHQSVWLKPIRTNDFTLWITIGGPDGLSTGV